MKTKDKLAGLLIGQALGDAIGLPFEGLSPRRIAKFLSGKNLQHRFLFGKGMWSDDTEHACLTAQSLLSSPDDMPLFARSLSWRLRFWFLGLPAGVGLATLRSLVRLWLGFSPAKSGVFSAGNGPGMRSPLIGACLTDQPERLRDYVRASTLITHSDPKAYEGALALALAAAHAMRSPEVIPEALLAELNAAATDETWKDYLKRIEEHLTTSTPEGFAAALGLEKGVTGFIYHSAAVALFVWLQSPTDFRRVIETTVRLGGDTDTVAAIAGSLAGATVGASQLPREWQENIWEWPRSLAWMTRLGDRLSERFIEEKDVAPLPLFWPGILPRNLLFLCVVLTHGFRRLLPPWG